MELIVSIIGVALVIIVPSVGWLFKQVIEQGKSIVRVETTLSNMGRRSAKILHSPHTPDLDVLLEKYESETITKSEAEKLMELLMRVESDTTVTKGERLAAAMIELTLRQHYRAAIG